MAPPPFLAHARRLGGWIGRWPIALATCFVLAAVILLPCVGTPGLWEPSERQLSDRVAPPGDSPEIAKPVPPVKSKSEDCVKIPPKDASARSLTARAIELGRDTFGDNDTGRRLPLALLGLVTALAAAGIAMRAGGARAGLVTACVLLSMPLMVLQSRMLTSDIGTTCGSVLILYGLFGLARPKRSIADIACSAIALTAGIVIGFFGGGALLGLLVPVGAFAAAGSFGVPLAIEAIKRRSFTTHVPALIATLGTLVLIGVLAYQMYYLVEPYPGLTPPPARQMFGQAIVAEGCWSSALGAIWRGEDDIRFIFDSTFEQIAYGTFPWGILGPIAMFALLRSGDPDRRLVGAITLAWAAAAWIATEAFHRKAGHAVWAAFPAIAIAIGVWLDDLLSRRASPDKRGSGMPPGAFLIALFVALATLDFGKDIQSFTDKLTSLLAGPETIPYPKDARMGLLPLRLWVLVFGVLVGLGFAASIGAWRDGDTPGAKIARRIANGGTAVMLSATLLLAAFWSFGWQPALSLHLSSKKLLETYDDLARPGEPLVVMGDLGYAPAFYTEVKPEKVNTRDQIVKALKRPSRVFAIAPQGELCTLHREMADQPYFVLEDRNLRNLLLSNRVDGTEDKNPLNEMIVHKEPKPKKRPKARIVFENRLELLGWDLPDRIERGDDFEIVTYWKVLSNVGGAWTMLMHFDGPLRLRDGDHKPIKDRCPTASWMVGDYIIDRHPMKTSGGNFPRGKYDVWIGFFTGSAPNFRNMPLSAAPGDMRDTNDRAKITSIFLD